MGQTKSRLTATTNPLGELYRGISETGQELKEEGEESFEDDLRHLNYVIIADDTPFGDARAQAINRVTHEILVYLESLRINYRVQLPKCCSVNALVAASDDGSRERRKPNGDNSDKLHHNQD